MAASPALARHAVAAATNICRRALGCTVTATYHATPRKSNLIRLMSTSSCRDTCASLLTPAGSLFDTETIMNPSTFASDNEYDSELDVCLKDPSDHVVPPQSDFFFIPQVKLHDGDGSQRKRVLVLCTGGTLTMA